MSKELKVGSLYKVSDDCEVVTYSIIDAPPRADTHIDMQVNYWQSDIGLFLYVGQPYSHGLHHFLMRDIVYRMCGANLPFLEAVAT